MTTPEPFALLLPVYIRDNPEYLRAAFRSAVHEQTLRPDHVLLVRDGPVTDELARCIDELCADSPVPVQIVPIHRSTGLGPALDAGLIASPHDIVARMDADDIALPNRFEIQVPLIRGRGRHRRSRDWSSSTPTPRCPDGGASRRSIPTTSAATHASTTRSTIRPSSTGAPRCWQRAATAICR